MKWVERRSVVNGEPYTSLVTDDQARELGRYRHARGGFVPDTLNNNAKPRGTQSEAQEFVLRQVLKRYKAEMAELGKLLCEAEVPKLRFAGSLRTASEECSTGHVPREGKPPRHQECEEFPVTEENQTNP